MNFSNISVLFQNSLLGLQNLPLDTFNGIRRTQAVESNNDSDSFEPEYHQIKKLGLKINKKKICTGGWSSQQNQVYLQFMIENSQDFLTQKARRKNKVFYRLSKIIKRRTPDQCRSHHQKLQLKYKDDLYSIMNEVQKKIQRCMAEEYVNQQHRQNFPNFEFFKMQFKPNKPTIQYEPRVNEGWFDIKAQGSSFKLTIDTNAINNW